MKLLVDMNLSPRWIPLLTTHGWDAVHRSSVGKASASDSEIMAFAAKHDYIVLTYDLDFSAILAATHGEKPRVVQIRMEDVSDEKAGPKVTSALRHMRAELEQGCLGHH
jgi:predicted nuclease of predicted toxin-antitoxin system